MAWNRADTSSQSAARKPASKSPSAVKGAIAGVVVVAVLGLAAFFIFGGKDVKPKTEKVEKKPAKIAEVKPAAASTNETAVVKKKPVWFCDASQTNGFTKYQQRKWEIVHRPRPKVYPKGEFRKAKCEIFGHRSENTIALLLTHKPGSGMIGTPVYGEKFEKDFIKSCEEPIVISQDDDEYVRNLKQQMKETKIELRQRMADGESLSKILMDTHKDLQRLGQIRQNVEKDMRQMIKEHAQTEADVDTYFEAANKILEQQGIAPMKPNSIVRRAFYNQIKNKETK